MIPRDADRSLSRALGRAPIVALLGPRQCGKTTLARQFARRADGEIFDLESPRDVARLAEAQLVLESLRGLVVLDEIQRMPDLLPVLRVLADRADLPARFLVLGSASPELMRDASETLAGRVAFVELSGFGLSEVGEEHLDDLWIRGGFPRSFLARDDDDSRAWRDDFIRTFLERDIPRFGVSLPPVQMRRFWTMLAHYHGQTVNFSDLSRSLGVSDNTIRRYIDVLTGTYMVRQLQPWHENLSKRQVKSPKIYVRDSGLLHALLGLPGRDALLGHPKLGASWEGFALEQVLSTVVDPHQAWFWATHGGSELDLLALVGGRRIGFEFKWTDAPRSTRSMTTAMADLRLDHLYVVHAGPDRFPIRQDVTAMPLREVSRWQP